LIFRLFGTVNDQTLRAESLKLHGVRPGFFGGVYQLPGQADIPVVIDSRLGNDEAGLVPAY
jgi:hypothetical protein